MVLMHHLVTGRQFSVYDLNRNNQCLYTINMEDPELKFKKQPNWLDIGISNNFIYIGDHDKFILWKSNYWNYWLVLYAVVSFYMINAISDWNVAWIICFF